MNCANYILSHKRLTAVDLRSFQNYRMARRKKEAKANQMPTVGKSAKGRSSEDSEWSEIEWETMSPQKVKTQGPIKTKEKGSRASSLANKRNHPPEKEEKRSL